MSDTPKRCGNRSPSWWTGRWRDWHRGHNCELDDGQPCTELGEIEFRLAGMEPGRPAPRPPRES